MGLGKKRSKYGRFMDQHGVKQEDVCRASGLNKDTVSKAYNDDSPKFRGITKIALIEAAYKLTGKRKNKTDFWA